MAAAGLLPRENSSHTSAQANTSGSITTARPLKPISSGGMKRVSVKDCRSSLSHTRLTPSRR